jgi:hypothetical protein
MACVKGILIQVLGALIRSRKLEEQKTHILPELSFKLLRCFYCKIRKIKSIWTHSEKTREDHMQRDLSQTNVKLCIWFKHVGHVSEGILDRKIK